MEIKSKLKPEIKTEINNKFNKYLEEKKDIIDPQYKVDLIDPYESWNKSDFIDNYLNLGEFSSLLPCITISG
jgi:hypothetical protein